MGFDIRPRSDTVATSSFNWHAATHGELKAYRVVEMMSAVRSAVGVKYSEGFSSDAARSSTATPRLNIEKLVTPYIRYARDAGKLDNPRVMESLNSLATQIGQRASAQHRNNPQQYVSHGFDHSQRVAEFTEQILDACPGILEATAERYKIDLPSARLMHMLVAQWHDIGYPQLDCRTKPTHGLCSASGFTDTTRAGLHRFIEQTATPRLPGVPAWEDEYRPGDLIAAMTKAIQLHSADVIAQSFPIRVKTDRGVLLVSDVAALARLLGHYKSSPSFRQLMKIGVRGENANELAREIKKIVPQSRVDYVDHMRVTFSEDKPEYLGRSASLDKENRVKVGLRYSEADFLEMPFAVIRLADNLDMTANRLSSLQRSAPFRTIYWTLGDKKPISQALSALASLNPGDASDVDAVFRHLRSAQSDTVLPPSYLAILGGVIGKLLPDSIGNLSPSQARQWLIEATVDSILNNMAEHLSEADLACMREVGYRMNEESILHFGGCEAVQGLKIKADGSNKDLLRIEVTVDAALYGELNKLKDANGVGVGEYQIARARQAFASLSVNGQRPVVEIIET